VGCVAGSPRVGDTWKDPERFPSLIDDVEQRLLGTLPDETWVYPGHGKDTTIGAERRHLAEWPPAAGEGRPACRGLGGRQPSVTSTRTCIPESRQGRDGVVCSAATAWPAPRNTTLQPALEAAGIRNPVRRA
jgi:glyoxylase-like metal-dependent hydrolase (beta-lactamase superfamily II)